MDVVCPHCKAKYLNVPSQYEGRTIRCKKCNNAFLLLRETGAPAPALKQRGILSDESKGAAVRQTPAPEDESSGTPASGNPAAAVALRRVGAESRDEWLEGDLVLDLYEVKRLLGEGAMGKVFRVRHREWNMDLAVKTPKAAILAKAGGVESFEREAETWVNLGLHPYIVSCYYVRRIGGIPRVFAEYVEGGSLDNWIGERKLYEGGPEKSLERMLDVAIQYAWGLHYAHEQELIHQDVKPGNVMVTLGGTVKVTDFGLARAGAVSETDSAGASDATMVVKGVGLTPAYASPEQLERRALTRRSDLWGWGLSVLEMFTGRRTWPVGSVALEALEGYLDSGAMDPEIPGMPGDLGEILRRCFRKNPEERPHDLEEVANALREIYREAVGRTFPRPEPKAGRGTADSLHNRAVSLLDLGRREDAERLWEEAVGVEPHHPEATYGRGLHLWRSGRMSDLDLLREMDGVARSHKDRWIVSYLLALVHLERGDYRTAERLLKSAKTAGGDPGAIRPAMERAKKVGAESIMPDDDHRAPASVSFSPDGRFILTASEDGTIRLRDIASGRCVRTFEGHTDKVEAAYLTPGNKLVVSAGRSTTSVNNDSMRLWDVGSGRCIRTWHGHFGGLSLSADGRFALTGNADNDLKYHFRLWEIASGRCVHTFAANQTSLRGVSLSADGRRALTSSRQYTKYAQNKGQYEDYLRLWDTESGECLVDYQGNEASTSIGPLSSDGRHMLRSDGNALAWWEIGMEPALRTFEGHSGPVTSVFLGEGDRLALSGSEDCTVKLWEVKSGRCLRTFDHTTPVSSVSLARGGRVAASTGRDGTFKLWDVPAGRCLRTVDWTPIPIGSVFLSRDGHRSLSGKNAGTGLLDLWDTTNRRRVRLVRTGNDPDDGRSPVLPHDPSSKAAFLVPHDPSSRAVSSDEDVRLAVTGSEEGALNVWDMETGKLLSSFSSNMSTTSDRSHIKCLSLLREGRHVLVVASSLPWGFGFWDLTSGRCVRTFEGHRLGVESVFLSPDSKLALSGGWDCTVKLWDVATANCIRTFKGHTGWVDCVSLSENGRCALSAAKDGTLRVWEAPTGRCLRVIEAGKGRRFRTCAPSPDGSFVVAVGGSVSSSDANGTLQVWEVASGRCLRSFEGVQVSSIFLSRDGTKLLAGGGDTMRLFPTTFELQPYKAPLMLARVTTGEKALDIQSEYEAHLRSANAAMNRGDAAEAAKLLRPARSLPGYGRAADAMALWQDLYLRLPIRGFRGTWEALSFQGHKGEVSGISLSADGCYALTGSKDKTVKLWETATGKCIREFHGHGHEEWWSVCLSEDGTLALSGGNSNNRDNKYAARLWDTATGRCMCTFECNGVYSVSLSRNKHRALLMSFRGASFLHDTRTGRPLQLVRESSGYVNAGLLTQDDNHVLSGSQDKTFRLWEVSTGHCVRTFKGHLEEVNSLSTDAAGRYVLSSSRDRTLKLWNIATGVCVQTIERTSPKDIVSNLSMNGKYVLSGEQDGSIKVWDTASGNRLHTFQAHGSPVAALALSRDNRFVMSGSMDGEIKLWILDWELEDRPMVDWDEEAQPHLDIFHNHYTSTAALPECTASRPWSDEDFQRMLHTLRCSGYGYIREEGVRNKLEAMCRPYEKHVAAAREALEREDFIKAAGELRLARSLPGFELEPEAFDLWSRLYERFPRKALRNVVRGPFFPDGHQGKIRSLCFSRDGWHAMSGNMPYYQKNIDAVKVWDVRAASCLRTFEYSMIPSGSGCLSAGGGRAALYCGKLGIFDTQTGQLLHSLSDRPLYGPLPDSHWNYRLRFFLDVEGDRVLRLPENYTDVVECTCLSRDGRYALSGSYDKTARYWDLEKGLCLWTLTGHQSTVMSVSFSADGRRALTGSGDHRHQVNGSDDNTLRLWDLESGECLQIFSGHEKAANSVCLSEDGRYALSGSDDKTLKLWETDGGRCIWTSDTMTNELNAVALSPNGRHILAGDENGGITLWLLDWELEDREPSDWDPAAAPLLNIFLNRLSPEVLYKMVQDAGQDLDNALNRWTEKSLPAILHTLGCAGFGFLHREGVQRALSEALSDRMRTFLAIPSRDITTGQ